jgi:hypothetical protein
LADNYKIEKQARPLIEALVKASTEFEGKITRAAFALAHLRILARRTVAGECDSEADIKGLHNLLNRMVEEARKAKAEGRLTLSIH